MTETNFNSLLTITHLIVNYSAVRAVNDISFKVPESQITTLIGSNGAGKTTLLKAISGLVRPSSGSIHFFKESITHLPSHWIVRKKISHVPEGRGIFLNLSVEENLDLGAWPTSSPKTYRDDLNFVFDLFPRLKERRNQNAGTLSGGEQQMLAIGRALMAHPKLLILDEPSLGLAPKMVEKIFQTIQTLHQKGMTILLVEQNAFQALQIAHDAIVLETGKIVLQGKAKTLLNSDLVRQAYLGG